MRNTLASQESPGGPRRLRPVRRVDRGAGHRRAADARGGLRPQASRPRGRRVYWLHVAAAAGGRLAVLAASAGRAADQVAGGPGAMSASSAAAVAAMVGLHAQDPRKWNVAGPEGGRAVLRAVAGAHGDRQLHPGQDADDGRLLPEVPRRTSTPAGSTASHHFSSFNNPAYLASVRETREVSLKRDGNVQGLALVRRLPRSGAVLQRRVRRPEVRRRASIRRPRPASPAPSATRSRTSTARSGNADYTIEEPEHYPFAFSENPLLQWVNNQLVKAKPEFHKKTFLKPLPQDGGVLLDLPQGAACRAS